MATDFVKKLKESFKEETRIFLKESVPSNCKNLSEQFFECTEERFEKMELNTSEIIKRLDVMAIMPECLNKSKLADCIRKENSITNNK